jgi:hypothetical protein
MKTVKEFSSQISLFLASLVLFVSCEQYETSIPPIEIDNKQIDNYTPEEVFRGIFFLQGQFAKEIPTLKRINDQFNVYKENVVYVANKAERELSKSKLSSQSQLNNLMDKQYDFLIDEITKMNPNFFNDFIATIKEKDPDLLVDKMKESALLMKAALYKTDNFKESIDIIEKSYEEEGIDPQNYDFTKISGLESYNNDIEKFFEKNQKFKKSPTNIQAIIIVSVVFLVFLGAVFLAAVAVAGEIAIAYFNLIFLHNWAFWADGDKPDTWAKNNKNLGYNLLIQELILFD